MSKKKKIFPLANVGKACLNKWAWSTVWLNRGTSSSCHRVKGQKIDLDNFDDFHNLPKKIQDRQDMLNGQWPQGGCEYCQRIEQAGGKSDRLQVNDQESYETPIELETDLSATSVTPTIIEFFADNTCNLRCIYCSGELSSRIQEENKKYGLVKFDNKFLNPHTLTNKNSDQLTAKFLDWLERNITQLARLHLLGGETYLQHDLIERVFGILERNPNPNLEFNIFSNFNAPQKYFYGYNQRIKDLQSRGCIHRFNLTWSIDCWGPQQSYVRSGLDLALAEEYFIWASEQSDWLNLMINQTVSNMTIVTMPDLIKLLNKHRDKKEIEHYFSFVQGFSFQRAEIFDFSLWQDSFDNILELMPQDTVNYKDAYDRMLGIKNTLQEHCKRDDKEIEKLHAYLDELDRRRDTDWRSLFPYLI